MAPRKKLRGSFFHDQIFLKEELKAKLILIKNKIKKAVLQKRPAFLKKI